MMDTYVKLKSWTKKNSALGAVYVRRDINSMSNEVVTFPTSAVTSRRF